MSLKEQAASKQRELDALKKITALTDTMKLQLDELNQQVKNIENNGKTVADVLSVWDSVTKSISEAGLGLLRYVEKDYEAHWDKDSDGMPLPEPLVRVYIKDEDREQE